MVRPLSADVADAAGDASAREPRGALLWSQRGLSRVPGELLAAPGLSTSLVRLDLSLNRLESLPDAVGALSALRELLVHGNARLAALPDALGRCDQLRVLDASSTALAALPSALGRLELLRVLAVTDTPLERRWVAKGVLPPPATDRQGDYHLDDRYYYADLEADGSADGDDSPCHCALRELRRKDERARLKRELRDALRFGLYRLDRSDAEAHAELDAALKRVLARFPLADDLRALVRNAERFLPRDFSPAAMRAVDPEAVRAAFDACARASERDKRAADLELRLRALYFGRVEPPAAEDMVRRIYAHVPALADVKFLLAHAAELLPADPAAVDGADVRRRIGELQHRLAAERQAATDKLLAAVAAIYSDTEPDQVQALVAQVAALFKNTKDLRSLAADAASLFPGEFLNAHAAEIRAAFLRAKADAMGGAVAVSAANTRKRLSATTARAK